MKSLPKFNELHNSFRNDVDMYIIYIGEAHPSDGWNLRKSYYADQPSYPKHKSMIERLNVAKDFENTVKSITTVPIFVDNFENKTDEFFIALPERLVIIDNKRVSFIGGEGPWNYSIDAAEAHLKSILEKRT